MQTYRSSTCGEALAGEIVYDKRVAIFRNLATTVEDYTQAGGMKKLVGSGSLTTQRCAKAYDSDSIHFRHDSSESHKSLADDYAEFIAGTWSIKSCAAFILAMIRMFPPRYLKRFTHFSVSSRDHPTLGMIIWVCTHLITVNRRWTLQC